MKKILIMLMVLGMASCKSGQATAEKKADSYKFENNVLYFNGREIGHVEAVKLQEKDGDIRREIVLSINNETDIVDKAFDIIRYMKSHNKNSDIELKLIVEKRNK